MEKKVKFVLSVLSAIIMVATFLKALFLGRGVKIEVSPSKSQEGESPLKRRNIKVTPGEAPRQKRHHQHRRQQQRHQH